MNRREYTSLEDGWISGQKWLWSEQAGRDIGVPETVDRIIEMQRRAKIHPESDYLEIKRRGEFTGWLHGHPDLSRDELIEGYLFRDDIGEWDGTRRLRGELRRFVSLREGVPDDRVVINCNSVKAYCEDNFLLESTGIKMLQKLRLFPFAGMPPALKLALTA